MSKIVMLGCGAWATTVAQLAAENQHDVTIWCHKESYASAINTTHTNPFSLPDVPLLPIIRASLDLEHSLASNEFCILGVPSVYLPPVLSKVAGCSIPVLSLVKGVLNDENWLLSSYFKAHDFPHLAVLSGPNLAKEIARKKPAASVVACSKPDIAEAFQSLLSGPRFRIYTSTDTVGVECGGILKNVMAIAAGICDGLHLGQNAKSSLLTRGLKEISEFGKYLDANIETFYGLSGLGDLMATCHSDQSRNWKIGYGLGTGETLESLMAGSSIPEGVRTTQFIAGLAKKLNIDMPITTQISKILSDNLSPYDALSILMQRELKSE